MRTTGEILSDARDVKMPTHEECFYAMLALASKIHLYHRDLRAIAKGYKKGKVSGVSVALRAGNEEKLIEDRMIFSKQDPKKWLGKEHDPFTKEAARFRNIADNLLRKVIRNK
jgi:hypothetical protein